MFKHLKFPLVYIVEILLWLTLLAGFWTAVAFLAATPIASLDLQGKSLPASWEAAVPNHDKFLQGYLISNHPIAFALGMAALISAAALLYQVHKAQVWQRQEDGGSRAKAHKIAHACVFALLAAIGYLLISQYFVGIKAA